MEASVRPIFDFGLLLDLAADDDVPSFDELLHFVSLDLVAIRPRAAGIRIHPTRRRFMRRRRDHHEGRRRRFPVEPHRQVSRLVRPASPSTTIEQETSERSEHKAFSGIGYDPG